MKIIAKSKKAYLNYDITDIYDCGIVLQWHEVKAIKTQHCNISHAFSRIIGSELWIYNMDIPLYEKTSPQTVPGYDPQQNRKLLVKQKELAKISAAMDKKGIIPVPLTVYLDKRWRVKIKIWMGKLRKKVEKKQYLKEKSLDRQAKKDMKQFMR